MKRFFTLFLIFLILAKASYAQPIIRDTEIEEVIRKIANPIFKSAGLRPDSIQIYIVNDSQINAYVAGGNNIFIHTGLLSASKDPNMLAGVLAHETGHIVGKHLLLASENARNTAIKTTFGYMLGLAAAAAGAPKAGVAIASGAQQVAEREILKHTRTQEESADQSALRFLDNANLSSKGLLEVLEILYGKEVGMYNEINPYTLTHPLSRERIDHVRNHLKSSPYANNNLPDEIKITYERAIVKMDAFLEPYERTMKKYPLSNNSVNAIYARAIAYYKMPDINKSLNEVDVLIKQYPQNPYFVELKGQILFENGRIQEAISYYQKAKNMVKSASLLKIQLANAQIASEQDSYLKPAVDNLEQAIRNERNNSFAWHQLGIAYGRMDRLDMSYISLAEESLLKGDKNEAKRFIKLARNYIKPGSQADLRANDLEKMLVEKNKD